MNYSKILLALDRLPQASIIFEQALVIAQKFDSSLMIFHNLNCDTDEEDSVEIGTFGDVDVRGSKLGYRQERLEKKIEEVKTWLTGYCEQAKALQVNTEFHYQGGIPGRRICDLATSWNADLIIVGHRGYTGISEAWLGSVSSYVLHHANCSVLVVQGRQAIENM